MLSFLYPAFLAGAVAVAIPFLLHLLRNEEAPELRFGAVRLLRAVKVEHTQRRQIRDWLLLALRAAALLLLAVTFARPYFPGHAATVNSAAVILLDRSGSMAPGPVWSRARAAAFAAIDRAAPGEAVAVIAFDDRPEVIVGPTLDRAALRAAVDRVRPGSGATRYPPAVSRAVSLLEEVNESRGRIVLVSDLQGTISDARSTLPQSVQLEIANVAVEFNNVALLAARRITEGVAFTLRNDGSAPRQVRVIVEERGRRLAEKSVDLGASQSVETSLALPRTHGPLRVAIADPDSAGLAVDDARYVDSDDGERLRVLVVAGPQDDFYVDAALRANDDRPEFDVAGVRPQEVAVALAKEPSPDVVFIVGVRGFDGGGREALVRFVQNGGGVMVAASDAADEPAFAPVVEGMEISAPHGDDAVLTLAALDGRHPLFRALAPVSGTLSAARFTRTWRVRAPAWQTLARFDDGKGAVFERMLGRGRIVVFASDLNRGWNDLPLQTAFVPLVQETARYLSAGRESREYTPATLPSGVPAGPGLVRLPSGRSVVVNVDPRESDPARMSAGQFTSAITHRDSRQSDPQTARRRAQAAEQGQGIWRYGLMLMFGTLVAEGLIASRRRS